MELLGDNFFIFKINFSEFTFFNNTFLKLKSFALMFWKHPDTYMVFKTDAT